MSLPEGPRGILVDLLVLGELSPFYRYFVPMFVSVDEIERYQFLRMILEAANLDSVVDLVLDEIEIGLKVGEMP